MALAVRFPVPDDRTAGSYQKVERKVGDFATAAAAVHVSLNADGSVRQAGIALSAAGPCAVRVGEAEGLLAGRKLTADADPRGGGCGVAAQRAAGRPAGRRRVQETSGRRPRGAWPAPGRGATGGAGMKVSDHGERRRVRARRRAAHAARVLPARALRAHRHARRLRHLELRLLRRRPRRRARGEVVRDVRRAGRRPRGPHRRGTRRGRRAPPDPAGVLGQTRAAVRLLHARDDAGVVRAPQAQLRSRARPTSAKASRAICAGAPATRTSSRPCSRPPTPCASRPRRASEPGGRP